MGFAPPLSGGKVIHGDEGATSVVAIAGPEHTLESRGASILSSCLDTVLQVVDSLLPRKRQFSCPSF